MTFRLVILMDMATVMDMATDMAMDMAMAMETTAPKLSRKRLGNGGHLARFLITISALSIQYADINNVRVVPDLNCVNN